MRSLIARFIIIIIVLWVSLLALQPTYKWYFSYTEEDKKLAKTTKKEFQNITQQIENQTQFIREAIKDPTHYMIALTTADQDKNNFVFDVSYESDQYKTGLSFSDLKNIVQVTNTDFHYFDDLEKNYSQLQQNLSLLEMIKKRQNVGNHVIRLGLDIAGGVRFVLGIDQDKLKEMLDNQYHHLLDPIEIKKEILETFPKITEKELNQKIHIKINERTLEKENLFQEQTSKGLDQALVKIVNRIDQFGVSEPIVVKGSNNTIVVELAGEKDVESAKEIFTRVGLLSFHLVDEDVMKQVSLSNKYSNGTVINPLQESHLLPVGSSFLYTQTIDKFDQPIDKGALAIYNKIELGGEHIKTARVDKGSLGESLISFSLDSQGEKAFADITTKNVNKRLAIVLDGKIQSAPNIKEPILGGKGNISGSFSAKEANLLSTILRSGSLPIPLKIEEERVVGPSLGQSEIMKGIHASLLALFVISIFIFIYYGLWGGMSTTITQLVNLFIILASMACIGATLTLPGIGAIVLTIGMNIDANVILHEKIKEEIRAYSSLENAIETGYRSGFKTILDSNLTTFIPGFVLAVIGNGPIRGFGVTLMIGLIINIFTAIFVTRFIYDFLIDKCGVKNILWSKKYEK